MDDTSINDYPLDILYDYFDTFSVWSDRSRNTETRSVSTIQSQFDQISTLQYSCHDIDGFQKCSLILLQVLLLAMSYKSTLWLTRIWKKG